MGISTCTPYCNAVCLCHSESLTHVRRQKPWATRSCRFHGFYFLGYACCSGVIVVSTFGALEIQEASWPWVPLRRTCIL